ncbi:MAG: hypothetical protein BRC33_11240 [Cyanobacteria bacterium SW_9_44_58]|nr:MAG: hypothetical protein BRC33_11240 [Cyanobacteria bacterium SW_9_44_58]
MRHLTVTTLTALLLSVGVIPTIQTESMASNQAQAEVDNESGIHSTEAFDLVARAYRGELTAQGIPSYYELEQAYEAGEIDAETLVNKAIEGGILPPATANDAGYITAVTLHLDRLTQERGN